VIEALKIGFTEAARPLELRLASALGCIALGLFAGVWGCDAREAPGERPNIVLIIGDDHGYRDFGFMGSEHVQTPSLDRLAAGGTLFRNVHNTSSICRPSLRSYLTGLHPYQWQLRVQALRARGYRAPDWRLIENFETLPTLLRGAGYASMLGGKLFEESFELAGFTHGIEVEVDESGTLGEAMSIARGTMAPIFDFLDSQAEESEAPPFFLWYAPLLPHTPHNAPPRYARPYKGRGFSREAVAYYASIAWFDESVGRLLEHLEKLGLLEDSLVVYIADNGWDQPPQQQDGQPLKDGDRGKMTLYETGSRTPMILSWPGRIPASRVSDELVSGVDLFPTLLDYAGVALPENRPGRSLRPYIEERAEWQRSFVVGHLAMTRANENRPARMRPQFIQSPEPGFFYRDHDWRYVSNVAWGTRELYEIEKDPDERRNLARRHPERADHYQGKLKAWQVETAAMIEEERRE
jgi:arylsulfatase A-like enzyme